VSCVNSLQTALKSPSNLWTIYIYIYSLVTRLALIDLDLKTLSPNAPLGKAFHHIGPRYLEGLQSRALTSALVVKQIISSSVRKPRRTRLQIIINRVDTSNLRAYIFHFILTLCHP
jgi:hypothetical protein